MRWPSLTPAGTRTFTSRGRNSLPVPRHVGHGRSTTMPRPPTCGQGWLSETRPWSSSRASCAHGSEAADLVVRPAPGGVAEDVARGGHVLELLLIAARIGMMLLRKTAVRSPALLVARAFGHPQRLVVVLLEPLPLRRHGL